MRLTLDGTADLLRWEPAAQAAAADEVAAWRSTYERRLEERFAERAAAHPEAYEAVARALGVLPPPVRTRFLRAPSVATLVLRDSGGAETDAALLEEALARELTVTGLLAPPPNGRTVWNVRGDRSLPEGPDVPRARDPLPGLDVAVDTASPFRFPDGAFGLAGGTVPYGEERLATVVERMRGAARVLTGLGAPAAYVEAFAQVVAVRQEPEGARRFHSSSFSGLAGCCRLTNAHLPHVTPALLAEALVHEATHGRLYLYEELREPFLRRADANDRAVTSPWTGATIRLQSFLHACAVWYAVHWFWVRARDAGLCEEAEADARTGLARDGFRRDPAGSVLRAHAGVLTGSARSLLEQLRAATAAVVTD
ncbi:hypothetical protein GCM10009801_63920 [Streptomyces albiaxialis]|uniref:HEXXH motif domain-containing protein n=1 Tax=Streptomyces albiaxialis TaxID=329523 RepID=A0ABN2WMT3_9ACTN